MAESAPRTRRYPLTGFARLAVVTTVLSLVLVALGGAVRAFDAGLACPTWPGCFAAGDFLPAFDFFVWLEHSHRLLAGAVGLLIAGQLLWALARYRHRPAIVWPTALAAAAVIVQAALGALVVLHLLRAELVTAHLGMAMTVVACLVFITVHATLPPRSHRVSGRDLRLARASLAVSGVALLQILVGGHVTGVGAGLVFVDRPLLGLTALTPLVTESQFYNAAHRVLAAVVVLAVLWLLYESRRAAATGWLRRLPLIAVGLVLLQAVIGILNLATGTASLVVVAHLAVASWIWVSLALQTILAYRLAPGEEPLATPSAEGPQHAGSNMSVEDLQALRP